MIYRSNAQTKSKPQRRRRMSILYRCARPEDTAERIAVRGLTRQNAISADRLARMGITVKSWSEDTRSGAVVGQIAEAQGQVVGFCFGSPATGEVLVLAVLPDYEGRGIGRTLLREVCGQLLQAGHDRLFLSSVTDPSTRSHGFYRHLGWRSTGALDAEGDEVLEFIYSKQPTPLMSLWRSIPGRM